MILLSVEVAIGGWLTELDRHVANHFPGPHADGIASLLLAITWFVAIVAKPEFVVPLVLGVAAWWSWRVGSREVLRAVLIRVVLLTLAVLALKALLHRPGPPGSPQDLLLGYYPSGHTATAVVCAGTLALLASRRRPRWRSRFVAASALWSVVVAASMVYHGYHWLTDVLGGLLLGTLVLLVAELVDPLAGSAPGRHSGRRTASRGASPLRRRGTP